jgi:hypothetical protein
LTIYPASGGIFFIKKCDIFAFWVLMSMGIYFIMMKDFDELEQLFERYNYRQMDKQQLYELIKMPLFDRKVFEHFFMYKVTPAGARFQTLAGRILIKPVPPTLQISTISYHIPCFHDAKT